MCLPTVWLIGDCNEPVFYEAVAWLHAHTNCQIFDSIDAATAFAKASNPFPAAIAFVQSRPGEFSAAQIETLHAKQPLAQLIALTGPWCEGEQRSGRPVAGVTRIAWRNWRQRLPLELAASGHASPPRTAAEIERIEQMAKLVTANSSGRGLARICTGQTAVYDHIADATRQLGFQPLPFGETVDPSSSPEVVVFDGWQQVKIFDDEQSRQRGERPIKRLLLLHFPRPEDHVRARKMGIDSVLAQPLVLADLKAALLDSIQPAA